MTIRLSSPQAVLLSELMSAGDRGVFKSTGYGPASMLITLGFAKWLRKYDNGRSGTLVITKAGIEFKQGPTA